MGTLVLATLLALALATASVPPAAAVAWCGATTAVSSRCVVDALPAVTSGTTVAIATSADSLADTSAWAALVRILPPPHRSPPPPSPGYLAITLTNLVPDTRYSLALIHLPSFPAAGCSDGACSDCGIVMAPNRHLYYLSAAGAVASFTFAAASCASTGSAHAVFDDLARAHPLFFAHMGDLYYKDIAESAPWRFASALRQVFDSPTQSALYASTSVVYIHDDHDYGPNDSDAASPARPAALASYLTAVPHYPLASRAAAALPALDAAASPAGAVNGSAAYTRTITPDAVGRTGAFLLTDLRASSNTTTRLGPRQRGWLTGMLERASRHALVVWISSVPWIGAAADGDDSWRGVPHERAFIANELARLNVTNLVMISGDAHMVAIDSGIHTNYANASAWPDSIGGGFPALVAAPLDRIGSTKGGPYTEGCHGFRLWKTHQYGLVRIDDSLEATCVTLSGHRYAHPAPLASLRLCTPFAVAPANAQPGNGASGSCSMAWLPVWAWVTVFFVIVLVAVLAAATCFTVYRLRATWAHSRLARQSAPRHPTFRPDVVGMDELQPTTSVIRRRRTSRRRIQASDGRGKPSHRRRRRRKTRRTDAAVASAAGSHPVALDMLVAHTPRTLLRLELDDSLSDTPFNPSHDPSWLRPLPLPARHPRAPSPASPSTMSWSSSPAQSSAELSMVSPAHPSLPLPHISSPALRHLPHIQVTPVRPGSGSISRSYSRSGDTELSSDLTRASSLTVSTSTGRQVDQGHEGHEADDSNYDYCDYEYYSYSTEQ
ncbi:uncharacterized protein AMSG_06005 [Thecamonas trahens ATCC 50062]|uniref:PhoD-like phosphatase metallophosphatase domain-containing protein n=1 Tax=Thecamonas trahens ATCC 50062 TaxID=461836 RepID=A0A0L0DBX1_THETB|nr:hypothetical protein AMSG_06005 [Thecamonas trahens ATCC 50062]KNC49735.1 hypothetical protein AMSG_06005 [Thecamonas trahens ATCC 50062]|eukprot:XP_013757522.1 hypothetical protein AMSG_06005 [Thecamonas trahens ATCC 50062]